MDRTAGNRWLDKVGKSPTLWHGVTESQEIVTDGRFTPPVLSPPQSADIIKYGGDWGGLWGNPSLWGSLSPNHESAKVVPYLFCLPEHWQAYRDIIGGLFQDGYPAVVLDIEEQWRGYESVLRSLLQTLNLEQNLIGVCGYGWFVQSLWPDSGEAFGKAINDLDIVYMPMAYMSDWGNATDGMDRTASDLRRLLPGLPYVTVWDSAALRMPQAERDRLPRIAESVWQAGALDSALWQKAFTESTLAPDGWPVEPNVDVPTAINSELGQALEYLDELETNTEVTTAQSDLINAVMDCIHTARKLNNGE